MGSRIKWHITKHAQQRRPHYTPIEVQELITFMQKLEDILELNKLDPGKYKMRYKGFGAIFTLQNGDGVLITIRRHNKILEKHLPKIKVVKAEAAFMDGTGLRVTRINYKGNEVKCGYIIKRPDGFKLLRLNADLGQKYVMPPYNKAGIIFKEIDEISKFVEYKNSQFRLKSFPRIHSKPLLSSEILDKKNWRYFKQLQIEKRNKKND